MLMGFTLLLFDFAIISCPPSSCGLPTGPDCSTAAGMKARWPEGQASVPAAPNKKKSPIPRMELPLPSGVASITKQPPGRSSGSRISRGSSAFPPGFLEPDSGRPKPIRSSVPDYSGGTAPDFNRVPYCLEISFFKVITCDLFYVNLFPVALLAGKIALCPGHPKADVPVQPELKTASWS